MTVDAISWDTILPAIRAWLADGSGLPIEKCFLSKTGAGRPEPPHIEIEIDETRSLAHDWSTREPNPLVFDPQVVTLVDPATDKLTIVGHALEVATAPFTSPRAVWHLAGSRSTPTTGW